jgi:hypothetical protein
MTVAAAFGGWGIMNDRQSSKTNKKRSTPGYLAMLGAIGTALAIVNMSVGTEAQSQPVLILEYTALALGLIALVGGLIMMMTHK